MNQAALLITGLEQIPESVSMTSFTTGRREHHGEAGQWMEER
jgi:hypothetical protein